MYTIVNDDEVLVGSIVAERYHVHDVIGQGSTGTVFGVEHLSFGRRAAMKVLRARYTSLETIRHVFQSETRAALSIVHPSLCEVFDLGTLPDGAPFYVMERLHGETLASRMRRDRFSAAAAVDMMMQLLAGMDALHHKKVLLRDLRPQNIFLAHRRGCRPIVKLLDIGLTRLMPLDRVQSEWEAARASVAPNETSSLLSVPYYLTPERARGDHGIEATNDIFIAAAIMYEALSGQRPFTARTWPTLVQQISLAQAPRLELLRPDLSEDLGDLIARCLSANPASRPPSARALQDELRAVFESPRRASTSSQIAVAVVPEDELTAKQSPALETRRESRENDEDAYDDETRTDRKRLDFVSVMRAAQPTVDESSAESPHRTDRPPALANARAATLLSTPIQFPHRLSAREPSSEIEVDVELGDEPAATRRGAELETTIDVAWSVAPVPSTSPMRNETDETAENLTDTAERARELGVTEVDDETATMQVKAEHRPPPTHPIRPPRQR